MWMAMVVEIKLLPHHLMRPNVIFLCACIVMGHGLTPIDFSFFSLFSFSFFL
jgi:hypothetical protein